MKRILGAGFLGVCLIWVSFACDRTLYNPGTMGFSASGPTPTVAAPQTITVSITSGSLGGAYAGYYYLASGFSNDATTGVLNLTAHVGDTVVLPNVNGFHPLYFDNGSTTCLFNGSGNPANSYTYTFPSVGLYYFHCGFHAQNCSLGLASCGSTNCTALAGVITVN